MLINKSKALRLIDHRSLLKLFLTSKFAFLLRNLDFLLKPICLEYEKQFEKIYFSKFEYFVCFGGDLPWVM